MAIDKKNIKKIEDGQSGRVVADNLHSNFELLADEINKGGNEVEVSPNEPTDPNAKVWIDPSAQPSKVVANVVQTTGTSTTDVMSQDAVTKELKKEPEGGYNRALYEAAGAVWHPESIAQDGTQGAYWLNGLEDITVEQMSDIYMYTYNYGAKSEYDISYYARNNTFVRTNIYQEEKWAHSYSSGNVLAVEAFSSSRMEVINLSPYSSSNINIAIFYKEAGNMFRGCIKLKKIIGNFHYKTKGNGYNAFYGCPLLESFSLYSVDADMLFKGTPNIDKNSLLNMINNRAGVDTLTWTMEKSMYDKYINDPDVTAAREAHNVSFKSL